MVGAEGFDGFVAIVAAKRKPLRRRWRAQALLSSTAAPSSGPGHEIISVFEQWVPARGRITGAVAALERTAVPGTGARRMYTPNTPPAVGDGLRCRLIAQEAVGTHKLEDCRRAGEAVVSLLKSGLRPRDILTRKAFENAITVVIALAGSTNAVLHLLAIAHEAGVRLTLTDFARVGRRVPVLADMRPSGAFLMSELIAIGGIQPLMKRLLARGLLHGDCLTVTGRTIEQNLADIDDYPQRSASSALSMIDQEDSHLVVLGGNSHRRAPWQRSPARKG